MFPTSGRGHFASSGFALVFIALAGGGPPQPASGTQKRAGKVGGMSVVINTRSDHDTELNCGVTDRVVSTFDGHRVEVTKDSATLDGKTKPLGNGVEGVTIDDVNGAVTVRAGGVPIFGPAAK